MQDADSPPEPAARRTSPSEKPAATDDAEPARRRGDSPADTLISPRLWKHVALSILALTAWGTMLYFGDRVDREIPGWKNIIGLQTGKIVTFFSTVALLAAGQLAFITLWYRSRSRKDFSGSYKLWFWVAVSWLVLCAFRATGSHWSLADAVLKQRELTVWNARLLLWLAPATISVVALYRLLLREMRDCDVSRWLLRLSAVAALAAGTSLLFGSMALPTRWGTLAQAGTASLWHVLLALSMLFHTRYVVHFSNEPPARPIRRLTLWIPRLRLPRLRRSEKPAGSGRKTKKAKEKAAAAEETKTPNRSSTATKARSTPEPVTAKGPEKREPAKAPAPVSRAAVQDRELVEDEAEDAATETPPVPLSRQRIVPPPAQQRLDPAQSIPRPKSSAVLQNDPESSSEEDDEDEEGGSAQGLSKKERKRLKRMQRERDRANR